MVSLPAGLLTVTLLAIAEEKVTVWAPWVAEVVPTESGSLPAPDCTARLSEPVVPLSAKVTGPSRLPNWTTYVSEPAPPAAVTGPVVLAITTVSFPGPPGSPTGPGLVSRRQETALGHECLR